MDLAQRIAHAAQSTHCSESYNYILLMHGLCAECRYAYAEV